MPDTVPAMLEPGEFVIRKDAAEKIGMDKLNMLNNADRLESGHSAIDELIALSTLSGSQQMMSGGNVKKMPQSGYMQDGGMAYIDPSDSTIVTKNSEQSELFDVLKNSINFAPGTTNKDALETFIDMLNNPNSYNRLDKDKDRNPIPILPPEEIKFDDPLEIDARQRMGTQQAMGNIGMMDNTSDKGILSGLSKMQRDIELLKMMESRYPNPKSMREYRGMKEDSGDIMNMDEMIEALSRAAGATQNKFKIPEYNNGGSTYSYGSGQTSMPSIADVYEAAGYMPNEEQLMQFQSQFLYDPSREESTVAGYMSNVADISSQAQSALGKVRSSSQGAGAGFAGFGERERLMSEAGSSIQERGTRSLESAQRGLFEDIRDQREQYLQDAGLALAELEGAGDQEYTRPEAQGGSGISSSSIGYTGSQAQEGEYFTGTDNIRYVYSNGSWRQV